MGDFIASLIPAIIIISLSPIMFFVKKNPFFGFRTDDTLSDEVVWKKSNRFSAIVFLIVGGFLILMSIISYLLKFNIWFKYYPLFFLIFIGLGLVICIIYSKMVAKRRKVGPKPLEVSSSLIVTILIISLIIFITGIVMPFTKPNSFIGIRISKTLSNPDLWRKVNTVGGIGFSLVGFVFSIIFFRSLRIKELRSKFYKNLSIFISLTIIWVVISILLPYIL